MLVNIQFLRFLAAMLVVLYHTAALIPAGEPAVHGIFLLGQSIGFAGVDIFFVISGFIMAYTTLESGGSAAASEFSRRRIARIFSGHWPFFFFAVLVFSWTRPQHLAESDLLASFFLWPQPLNRTLLEITWTLSFEMYFYLIFALLVWLIPQRRRYGVCAVITATLLLINLYRHFQSHSFALENLYLMPLARHFLLSPFILEFFAGALVAYRLNHRPLGPSTSWLIAGALAFLAGSAFNQILFSGDIEQGFYVVPRTLWFGSVAAMILTGLVRLENRSIKAPLRFSLNAGGASYAIYLSHILLLELARKTGLVQVMSELHFGFVSVAFVSLMAVIALLSIIHYQRLEQPLHRWFKRVLAVG